MTCRRWVDQIHTSQRVQVGAASAVCQWNKLSGRHLGLGGASGNLIPEDHDSEDKALTWFQSWRHKAARHSGPSPWAVLCKAIGHHSWLGLRVQQEVRAEALGTNRKEEMAYRTPQFRWIWIWRSSVAGEEGRRALKTPDGHFALQTA